MPVLVMRDVTRADPEGVEAGVVQLAGSSKDRIRGGDKAAFN